MSDILAPNLMATAAKYSVKSRPVGRAATPIQGAALDWDEAPWRAAWGLASPRPTDRCVLEDPPVHPRS